jgi:hypothetical protein
MPHKSRPCACAEFNRLHHKKKERRPQQQQQQAGHEFELVDGPGVVTLSFFNERAITIVAALLH